MQINQVDVPRCQGAFDQQAFHDFVLDQGMLPPDILKQAVMEEFVPGQLNWLAESMAAKQRAILRS